ncbi:uncharacterized protein FTOL_13971 [Fusarium torulosum]|uniref:Uncharacterized protein n=1 Tax=Fusarium torulosum TaxID=33205 RepID=A0AAE8MPS6_9HYPO|nr:uncharacterized protein FTOL_13971 [Fusarium torulosum]
MTPASMTNN